MIIRKRSIILFAQMMILLVVQTMLSSFCLVEANSFEPYLFDEKISGELDTPDPNFHIYIAFGQSNMEGQGLIEAEDEIVDEDFLMMCTSDSYNDKEVGKWYTAVPPLANNFGQLGPADYFGREMLKKEKVKNPNVRIGIIVVAVSGAGIELFDKDKYLDCKNPEGLWFQKRLNSYGGNPYGRLIECAKSAQKEGVIKGIIMHQGETNARDTEWPSNVKKVYDDMISDLELGYDIPLLAGEVLKTGLASKANENVNKLPSISDNFYVISSEGLNDICEDGEGVHFTSEEYRELGIRYANKMFEINHEYIVEVIDDGYGSGVASVSQGKSGVQVNLTANPNKGYVFKGWEVLSGNIVIKENSFSIGNEDVTIRAVFEKLDEENKKDELSVTEKNLNWKVNSSGWWVEDDSGWYPVSQWMKIADKWYYFDSSGYMAHDEYVDGCWLSGNGSWDEAYSLTWNYNSMGWWIQDINGWYPVSQWIKIDGKWYYFDSSGYMAANEYVDGYWLSSDGTWDDSYYLDWHYNSIGWWVQDITGWYPQTQWLKINGVWYYFDSSGYMN